MFGIGTGELLLILVIAMLVVGPEKMVEFAGKAGRFIARFRAQSDGITREFRDALGVDAVKQGVQDTMAALKGVSDDLAQAGQAESIDAPSPALALAAASAQSEPHSPLAPGMRPTPARRETQPTIVPAQSTRAVAVSAAALAPEEAEGVDLSLGQLVPDDVDAEAVSLGEPMLVAEDTREDTAASLETGMAGDDAARAGG
jgi:sec-independent protein translocase protein TatB